MSHRRASNSCGTQVRRNGCRIELLAAAGQRWDLFSYSVGDIDESYEIVCYRDGELIRHRRVDSPRYDDRVVSIDIGEPLPAETASLWLEDAVRIGRSLATAQGIDVCYRADRIATFAWD